MSPSDSALPQVYEQPWSIEGTRTFVIRAGDRTIGELRMLASECPPDLWQAIEQAVQEQTPAPRLTLL
jgi:hypothetical protein